MWISITTYPVLLVMFLGDEMKKVILHVGQYKTGTTSIQKMMWSSRDKLLEQDILYPESFVRDSAHFLITDRLRQEFRDKLLNVDLTALRKEIEVSPASTVVISCEALSGATVRRFAPEMMQYMWRRLAEALSGFDVRVVFYIRRQDESVDSRIIQEIKGQSRKSIINYEAFLYANSSLNYHYFTFLLAKVFGLNNLDVRLYDRGVLVDADVRRDFLDYLGVPRGSIAVTEDEDNVSPSSTLIALYRVINALEVDEQVYDELKKWVWREAGKGDDRKAVVIGQEQRQEIMRYFKHYNEKFIQECVSPAMQATYADVLFRDEKNVIPNVQVDVVDVMHMFRRMGLGMVKAS